VDVFQRQGRNTDSWEWEKDYTPIEFLTSKIGTGKNIAVSLALSTPIDEKGIYSVLGDDTTIYRLTIASPNRDFVTHPHVADDFIMKTHELLGQIRHENGQIAELHIFPAMPVSLAVRFGMNYMPKLYSPMLVYDYMQTMGFIPALRIGGTYETEKRI